MRRTYGLSQVLMTVDPATSEWGQAIELAKGLREHEVLTTIAAVRQPKHEQQVQLDAISDLTVHAGDPSDPLDWLLFLEGRTKPDLVHLFVPEHTMLAWRSPIVLSYHGRDFSGSASPSQRERLSSLLRAPELLFVPTGTSLRRIEAQIGPMENAVAVYPGLDADPTNWTQRKEMVLSVAEPEDLPLLEFAADKQRWPLYIAGDVHLDELHTTRNLFPVGRGGSATTRAWYGRSPIFVYCGVDDPFPMPVLEAAASGCALILADTPALRELWDRAAVFFSPGDPETLRAAITQVIDDEGLRQYLQMRARERWTAYGAKAMVRNVLFAYQEMLQAASLDLPAAGDERFEVL